MSAARSIEVAMARGCHLRLSRGLVLAVLTLATGGVAPVVDSAAWAQVQTSPEPSDLQSIPDAQNSVEQVVQSLQSHKLTPAQALDPAMDDASRRAQLGHFRSSAFALEINPAAPVATGSDGFASMQAAFRLRDGMTTRTRSDATLQFVQRGDRWYFANYNFLDVGSYLARVLIGLAVIAALLGWLLWSLLRRSRGRSISQASRPGMVAGGNALRTAPAAAGGESSRDPGFTPQGFSPGAQVPQVTAPIPQVGEPPPVAAASAADQATSGYATSERPGWQPEMEAAHPQTTAYPVAPARYDASQGAPRQGPAAGPQPLREAPDVADAGTPVAPPSEPANPQTTAYPEPPPRYDAATDPARRHAITGSQSLLDGAEPNRRPKPPSV